MNSKRLVTFLIAAVILLAAVPALAQWTGTNPIYCTSCSSGVGIGTSDPSEGSTVVSKLTVRQSDSQTGLAIMSSSGARRLAINPNSDGSFSLFDGGTPGSWTQGLTQKSGWVGIGTSGPGSVLEVMNNTTLSSELWLSNANATNSSSVGSGLVFRVDSTTARLIGQIYSIRTTLGTNGTSADLVFRVNNGSANTNLTEVARISPAIGGSSGTLAVTGNITATGTVTSTYQDLAEWVPSRQSLAPGTVVTLDSTARNGVIASRKTYDTGVAGVVSDSPGLLLGKGGEGKSMIATTGRVRVKVDATSMPVRVGDLLVTSDLEGYAMRSVPVEVSGIAMHRPGTLIGKALEPLEGGKGEILVLLSLQ